MLFNPKSNPESSPAFEAYEIGDPVISIIYNPGAGVSQEDGE